jgi:hypothetical protein
MRGEAIARITRALAQLDPEPSRPDDEPVAWEHINELPDGSVGTFGVVVRRVRRPATSGPRPRSSPMITRTDALHDALDRLAPYDYLDGAGFACHAPMGAEALSALGHDDVVAAWVEAYTARYAPIASPPPTEPIDPQDEHSWRPALGDFSRVSDWAAMFRGAVWDEPWQDVISRWVPRLIPGYGGGLTHGLLRVAHTVRAMPAGQTSSGPLLDELAKGLASWAAWFTELPGRPTLRGDLRLDEAIARLPRPAKPWSPLEAGTFTRLDELRDYPDAVTALARPSSILGALSELTAAFCHTMLANPQALPQGLVHTVTPVAAARTLLPYLPQPSAHVLYAQLWQVGAAIVVGFTPPPQPDQPAPIPDHAPLHPADIAARAIEHRDPHVVKFTEACTREHRLNPDPVYLYAAEHLLTHTPPW